MGLGGAEAFGDAGRTPLAVGHAVPLRHLGHPVRRLPPRRGPTRLRVRLRRGAVGRRRRAAGVLPADRRLHGVGRRPTARSSAATFDDELTRELAEPAAPHGPVARGRVAAHGARPGARPADRAPPHAPRGRRAGHRDGPGSTPRASPTLLAPTAPGDARSSPSPTTPMPRPRSPRSRQSDRPVDRRGADGVRGRRHPSAAHRRVRHDDDHRAVLPPGGRSRRALDPSGRRARRRTSSFPTTPAAPLRRRASPSSGGTACASAADADEEIAHAVGRSRRRPRDRRPEEQMSLFAVIGAVSLGESRRRGHRSDPARPRRRRVRRRPRRHL